MLYVIPLIAWTGISMAVFSGSFVVLMKNTMDPTYSDNKKTSLSMFAMIGLGMGEMIGSIFCG